MTNAELPNSVPPVYRAVIHRVRHQEGLCPTFEYLVLKRSPTADRDKNQFECPGGVPHPTETNPLQTYIRETFEETGLKVTGVIQEFFSYQVPYEIDGSSSAGFMRKVHFAIVEVLPPHTIVLSKEHVDFAWMTVDEILRTPMEQIRRGSARAIILADRSVLTPQFMDAQVKKMPTSRPVL